MLAFLQSLCDALIARDAMRIRALLSHPLARALPRQVRDEARAVADGGGRRSRAPLQALRLYHQTAQLLGVSADPAARGAETVAADAGRRQIELPLRTASAH